MGKIVAGVSLLVLSFGIANAEEFLAQITKVDGMKVTAKVVKAPEKGTFKKGGKGKGTDLFKDAETKTFTITSDTKITKRGKYDPDTMKVGESTALEDGVKNKLFTEATEDKPLSGRITVNDKGEPTEISVGGGKGKGNFKKKKNTTDSDF